MKKLSLLLLGIFFNLNTWAQVGPWLVPPEEVIAHYSRSYVPGGFDTNDNVEFFASGHYQNGCYKKGKTSVIRDLENHRIDVTITHYYSPDELCIMWVQPYGESVKLGVLPEGTYEIYVNGQKTRNNLPVHLAQTNDVDDYLYAPVSNVSFDAATNQLTLSGFFFDHCAEISEINMIKEADRNVIAVLPVVGFKDNCLAGGIERRLNRWEETVDVDMTGITDNVLFHVRAMNGESKNELVTLEQ